jgi:hypothetical protein
MTAPRIEGFNMSFETRSVVLVLGALMVLSSGARGQDNKPYTGPACNRNLDDYFTKEVWPKVGAVLCVQCHIKGGDAEESKLILQDPRKVQGHAQEEAMRHNRDALARLAGVKHKDQSRLLVKVTGGLKHGGGDVLKSGSKGHVILTEFVRRINAPPSTTPRPIVDDKNLPPFFDGLTMLDPKRLLRRVTLSLAGRLPTDAERPIVAEKGLDGLPALLDVLMKEDAFYDRLREGFNDIFLTVGLDGNPEATVLSYEHFVKTRLWTQKHDLSLIPEKERQKARYKVNADYRKALLGEPMKLVEHIVRNDRPFTEIVTADYIMVTPYSSRGYGAFRRIEGDVQESRRPFRIHPGEAQGADGAK